MLQKSALLSVSDKKNIDLLAEALRKHKIGILSTGGTAHFLRECGFTLTDIADYTDFPEMMDGRVKTLHPLIHGGILGRRDVDCAIMQQYGMHAIDIVAVNLYPFEETLKSSADFEEIKEQIDIGGPSLIRAAAKNHNFVAVMTRPSHYQEAIEALDENQGTIPLPLRQKFAAEAFADCAAYDALIADFMAEKAGIKKETEEIFLWHGRRKSILRYGENPHQKASIYQLRYPDRQGLNASVLLQGKPLSYNNYADAEVAMNLAFSYKEHKAVSIIKHATPCGVALGQSACDAYRKALSSDPVSAFGGIVCFNCSLDGDAARALIETFLALVLAPNITEEARTLLQKKPSLSVLKIPSPSEKKYHLHPLSDGFMVQDADIIVPIRQEWCVPTDKKPTPEEYADLEFGWIIAGYAKSNAIILAQEGCLSGIGTGQTSRLLSARHAADACAEKNIQPLIAASDGFFPFPDGLECLIKTGIKAVIQPGGSKRDQEVIDTANKAGIAMVMTGKRHFRH